MATSSDSKGRYEFVKKLPDDFTCLVCLDAVYDAVETKCCGVLLCMPCSDRLIASMMACPQCRVSPLVTSPSQFMRRKVRQLHIYCVNRDHNDPKSILYPFPINPNAMSMEIICGARHCEWSGEINDLQSHLDNHCPHATVTCQYNCGVKIVRCQKDFHEAQVCRKHPFSCWFCDMKATAEEIDGHANKCDKRPIECPNKCSAELLQGELKLHLEQCPLQKISCEFEHAGCKVRVLRKDYDSHIEGSTQQHLRLLVSEQVRVKKMIKILTQVHLLNINVRVTRTCTFGTSDVFYGTFGTSDVFYVLGYCMSVNGIDHITGTSVFLNLHPGQCDDLLSWPLQGVVTLLLLHPEDNSKNKELECHIPATQRPTGPVLITTYYASLIFMWPKQNEYRLSVKSATLY